MVQINFARREVNCKLVFYGPGLSGKTTNLEIIHKKVPDTARGNLTSIATEQDRTLFFDFMPLDLGQVAGMKTKLFLYTVPGQVYYDSTRKLVLQGADGVAFIADSQVTETENNAASFLDLRANLKELGISLKDMPVVLQFNKRDLPNIRFDAEIEDLAKRGREPVFKASAVSGEGVLETFFGLLDRTFAKLDAEHQLAAKIGISAAEFLPLAGKRLGLTVSVDALLRKAIGGRT